MNVHVIPRPSAASLRPSKICTCCVTNICGFRRELFKQGGYRITKIKGGRTGVGMIIW